MMFKVKLIKEMEIRLIIQKIVKEMLNQVIKKNKQMINQLKI